MEAEFTTICQLVVKITLKIKSKQKASLLEHTSYSLDEFYQKTSNST